MTLQDYVSLFTGSSREKQRFMAISQAILQQVIDMITVIGQFQSVYSIDNAAGVQLDEFANSIGIYRSDLGESVPDGAFRQYIKGKLCLWRWDGSNGTVKVIIDEAVPNRTELDNMNGSVTISPDGDRWKSLLPVPAGISITT